MADAAFQQAARWAETALLRGDLPAALVIFDPGTDEGRRMVLDLAAGWIKTCYDLADALGVDFAVIWEQARRGPVRPVK